MLSGVESLAAALREGAPNEPKTKKKAAKLLAASRRATRQERSDAVCRLSSLILLDNPARAGLAATVCGALVEQGADASPIEGPLLARLLPALRKLADEPAPEPAAEFPLEPAAQPGPVAPKSVGPAKRVGVLRSIFRLFIAGYKVRRVMEKHRREVAAMPVSENQAVANALQCPTIALFSADPSRVGHYDELRELSKALSDRVELCGWLNSLFEVLNDEPVLVIEPASRKGILARLSGADVNFMLNMLLMDRFPGGSRLTPNAASVINGGPQQCGELVKGVWNLYNWQAIQSDFSLPEGQRNHSHWIWNEGKPGDIAVLEGRRVILLGPAAYVRTWPAQRTFAAMKPELKIEKVLTEKEVEKWLEKMVASLPS